MKIIFQIFFLLIFLNSKGQKLESNEVIKITENYLKEAVGERLIDYFNFSDPNGSFYKMQKSKNGYQPTKSLGRNKKIKRNYTEIWIHWNFNFPEIKGVNSGLWVKLDKDLKLLEPIELDFIPDFLWKNQKSDFIGFEKAKEIGSLKLTKPNFGTDEPQLKFDSKEKVYVYEIWNKVTESTEYDGKKHGKLEIIRINALTGQMLKNTSGYYGKILIR
jgi:hypothetical protein